MVFGWVLSGRLVGCVFGDWSAKTLRRIMVKRLAKRLRRSRSVQAMCRIRSRRLALVVSTDSLYVGFRIFRVARTECPRMIRSAGLPEARNSYAEECAPRPKRPSHAQYLRRTSKVDPDDHTSNTQLHILKQDSSAEGLPTPDSESSS